MSVLCLGPMRGRRHASSEVLLLEASASAVPARAPSTIAEYKFTCARQKI